MKVVVYVNNPKVPIWASVLKGFDRHGLEYVIRRPGQIENCDLAVIWGVRNRQAIVRAKRTLVVERGYVGDRFHYTSMGFDGLNGYAQFYNDNFDSKRWDNVFSEHMRPWRRNRNGHVLLLGQVPSDMSLAHINYRQWMVSVVSQLTRTGHSVKFRPHPKARWLLCPGVPVAGESTLKEAALSASYVVAFNSNSLVDCVLYGVPAVACDMGSMAYPVTGHDPLVNPPKPDRTKWAHKLAYTQWSPEEIARGDAWDRLKEGLNDKMASGFHFPRRVSSSPYSSWESHKGPPSRREREARAALGRRG